MIQPQDVIVLSGHSPPVAGELLFRATTRHVTLCYLLNARLMHAYFHPRNVADFKGIRAG